MLIMVKLPNVINSNSFATLPHCSLEQYCRPTALLRYCFPSWSTPTQFQYTRIVNWSCNARALPYWGTSSHFDQLRLMSNTSALLIGVVLQAHCLNEVLLPILINSYSVGTHSYCKLEQYCTLALPYTEVMLPTLINSDLVATHAHRSLEQYCRHIVLLGYCFPLWSTPTQLQHTRIPHWSSIAGALPYRGIASHSDQLRLNCNTAALLIGAILHAHCLTEVVLPILINYDSVATNSHCKLEQYCRRTSLLR